MRTLTRAFWFTLAILFLVEAWLWENLKRPIAFVVRLLPLEAVKARIAAALERLPPWPTLLVFAIPVLVILPFKLAGLWLIAQGHPLLGIAMFFGAKITGLAVTAFLFDTCKPKLMQLGWFARLYAAVLRAKAWAAEMTAPARAQIRAFKAHVLGEGGRFFPLVARLRRRAALRVIK